MAGLLNLGKISLKIPRALPSCVIVATRNAGIWNKDWQPAKPPVTPEERERAAKKYGLRPGDYEPCPDDGTGFGDYPNLPNMGINSRDPFETYDMPSLKRNYGEPMPLDADILREDCYDPNIKPPMSPPKMFAVLSFVVGSYIVARFLLEPYPHFHPTMPKQFARDLKEGEAHYIFEPAE